MHANESLSKNKLAAVALIKRKFKFSRLFCATKLITISMLKLLNLHTVEFRYYQEKYYILHIAFISNVAFNSLFIFLSKHKALYKQNFLEYAFQIKI